MFLPIRSFFRFSVSQSYRAQITQTNFQHATEVKPAINFFDSFGFDKAIFSLGAIWLYSINEPINMPSEMFERKSQRLIYLTPLSHASFTTFHSFQGLTSSCNRS
jgi:hypothetical protein